MKPWLIALLFPFFFGCTETDGPESSDAPKEVAPSPPNGNRISLDDHLSDWAAGAVAVKAVVFDCAEGSSTLGFATHRRIVEDGIEHPYIVKDASVFLTTAEAATLAELVAGQHEPSSTAGCYVPHHGFIFYAEDDSIVAYIEVCLMCRSGGGVPREGLAEYWDYDGLVEFIREIGLPVFEKAVEWPPYFAQNREVEQGVAPQSATRSESDSDGGDKPKPESEPRPR